LQCAEHLCGFLRSIGVSKVLNLHTARSIALSETASDFRERFREAYPHTPSRKLHNTSNRGKESDARPQIQACPTVPDQMSHSKWSVTALPRQEDVQSTAQCSNQLQLESSGHVPRLPMLISACPGASPTIVLHSCVLHTKRI
jgi:iron only hydrogenase large subunit-like protein